MDNETLYIGPLEVADRLDISLNTVYAWCRTGRIPCRRTTTGRYRIRPDDLVDLMPTEVSA